MSDEIERLRALLEGDEPGLPMSSLADRLAAMEALWPALLRVADDANASGFCRSCLNDGAHDPTCHIGQLNDAIREHLGEP